MLSLLFKALLIYIAFIFIRLSYRAYKTYVMFRNATSKRRPNDDNEKGESIEAKYRVIDEDED